MLRKSAHTSAADITPMAWWVLRECLHRLLIAEVAEQVWGMKNDAAKRCSSPDDVSRHYDAERQQNGPQAGEEDEVQAELHSKSSSADLFKSSGRNLHQGHIVLGSLQSCTY